MGWLPKYRDVDWIQRNREAQQDCLQMQLDENLTPFRIAEPANALMVARVLFPEAVIKLAVTPDDPCDMKMLFELPDLLLCGNDERQLFWQMMESADPVRIRVVEDNVLVELYFDSVWLPNA